MVDINAGINHVEIFNKITTDVPQHLQCESVGLLLIDHHEPNMMYCFMAQGIDEETPYAKELNKFPITIGLSGRCLQQRKTILYEVEVPPGATHLANTKDYIHYSEEVDNYASIHIRNSMFACLCKRKHLKPARIGYNRTRSAGECV